MFRVLTNLEIVLACVALLLAAREITGLMAARRHGLTQNVSRLMTYSAMAGLLVVYIIYSMYWYSVVTSPDFSRRLAKNPTFNWSYLILGVAVAIGTALIVLASYELAALYVARHAGRTENISRMLSLAAVILLLLAMMSIRTEQWELYLHKVEEIYVSGLPAPASR